LDGGRLVAYLIGDMVIDNLRGRSAWVRMPGCAYDPDTSVEVLRDLYATLGAQWVDAGIFVHFAMIPVTDPALIHAWFSLCFGIEQVYALLDLESLQPAMPEISADLTIRKATQADRQALAEMSDKDTGRRHRLRTTCLPQSSASNSLSQGHATLHAARVLAPCSRAPGWPRPAPAATASVKPTGAAPTCWLRDFGRNRVFVPSPIAWRAGSMSALRGRMATGPAEQGAVLLVCYVYLTVGWIADAPMV
jgi:hypothetical protein